MTSSPAAYLRLHASGELADRAEKALDGLSFCEYCAWRCGSDRTRGETGHCRTGFYVGVASFGPHHGEEAPIRGRHGSGTIFLSSCNLACLFCQNFDISQSEPAHPMQTEDLAGIMLRLQEMGCHNINFVSPSHGVPQILAALAFAADRGLTVPIVYNTGGYDVLETLALLDGIVDIYMPDMKFADPTIARRFSGIPDYPRVNQAAVREMYRQVGDLQLGAEGVACRGLLVRHLVLPDNKAGTDEIVRFLARDISRDTYVNLMDQYRPEYRARELEGMSRRITVDEYHQALSWAREAGLHRGLDTT